MKFGSSFKSLLYPPPSSSSSSPDSGSCFFCDKGQTSRCEQSRVFGSVPLDGAQAEYVLVPLADTTLYPIPAGAKPEVLLLMADVSSKKFKRKKPCRIIFTPSLFLFLFLQIFPTGFYVANNANNLLTEKERENVTAVVIGCGPVGLCAVTAATHFFKVRKGERESVSCAHR